MEHIGIDLGSWESQGGSDSACNRCTDSDRTYPRNHRSRGLETCTEAFRIAGRARQGAQVQTLTC